VPNGGVRKVGYTGLQGARCVVNRGVTPQNHNAQEGVSRSQWLIHLVMKPQWARTIWGIDSLSVYL
jgi:hypothetical protein